jgi:2-polyprenyl-3-methyl-5-hydroxy-6-metoxy-1,4-benzoquinol methylase
METTKLEFERIADIKRLNFIKGVLKQHTHPGANILDVGCGNGVITRQLGKEGYKVLGIDISKKAIEKANALNMYSNVQFENISAENLVATEEKYDAIVCSEVLEHLTDPITLLKVLNDSLKENGKLIITVPNGSGPRETFVTRPIIAIQKRNPLLAVMISKMKKSMNYSGTTVQSDADELTHVQFFTKRSLEKLAGNSGFQITKFMNSHFVDDIFPVSLFTRRMKFLQKLDSAIADRLPSRMCGGFFTMWEKRK